MHNDTQHLSVFGWNWSFLGDIQAVTDSEGNVTLLNSGIQSLLPQQLSGTALYETNIQTLLSEQLASNPYNLDISQLLVSGTSPERTFERQTDGSYQSHSNDKGILTQEGDHYQLQEKNGTVIVFRADGQLDYVEDANGYSLTAGYTNNQLTSLTAFNGDSFTLNSNAQGRIETITDQTGQSTTYHYDPTGQFLLGIEDSTGTTSFTYGHPYNPTVLTSVTSADGSKVSYDYDEFGRLQQIMGFE